MKRILLVPFIAIFVSICWAQVINNSLKLDGDDDFMITNIALPGNLTSITISCWVKAWNGGAVLSNHSHGVYWESIELLNHWFIINAAGSRQLLQFTSLADSPWHHISAVWDGAEMRMYVDGLPFGDSLAAVNPPWNSFAKVAIGARESFVTPLAVSELKGYIEEVRVWNVPRSQPQIQATMNDTIGPEYYGYPDSGLIAYWRFDTMEDLDIGGDGTDDIRDYSVSQLHGDLVGDAS